MSRVLTRYQLDSDDRIRQVGGDWNDFARRNGAPELNADAVVGRPLWEFIAGPETRHLYQVLLRMTREQQRAVNVPFRCDSPTCRRDMELSIAPAEDGAIELSATLTAERDRPYVALLDPNVARSDALILMCSWCKRILAPENEWLEIDQAIDRFGLLAAAEPPSISHSICPACESSHFSDIES